MHTEEVTSAVQAPHLEDTHNGGCQGRVAHGTQEERVVEQHPGQAEENQCHPQPDTAQLGSRSGSRPPPPGVPPL